MQQLKVEKVFDGKLQYKKPEHRHANKRHKQETQQDVATEKKYQRQHQRNLPFAISAGFGSPTEALLQKSAPGRLCLGEDRCTRMLQKMNAIGIAVCHFLRKKHIIARSQVIVAVEACQFGKNRFRIRQICAIAQPHGAPVNACAGEHHGAGVVERLKALEQVALAMKIDRRGDQFCLLFLVK